MGCVSVNSAAYRQALKPKNKVYPTYPIADAVRLSKICVKIGMKTRTVQIENCKEWSWLCGVAECHLLRTSACTDYNFLPALATVDFMTSCCWAERYMLSAQSFASHCQDQLARIVYHEIKQGQSATRGESSCGKHPRSAQQIPQYASPSALMNVRKDDLKCCFRRVETNAS